MVLVPSHDGIKKFGGCPQKNGFRAQKQHFWAQKGPFCEIGAMKRPAEQPNGHILVYRVTSGYGGLKIPLGRIHLTPKNGGYMGENGDFRAGGHWEKLRSSETKRATTDRLVPKRQQFRWLRSRKF